MRSCEVSARALALLLLPLLAAAAADTATGNASTLELFREVYVWKRLDFAWPDDTTKAHALDTKQFQPENCALEHVRAWGGRLFLTLPRWKPGVPATLAAVPALPQLPNPRLEPFPSWDMQTIGNCSAFQSVQSLEIDADGQLWALDKGEASSFNPPSNRCPPKVVIVDLSRGGAPRTLPLPREVLAPDSDFGAMVLDGDGLAYVSDGSKSDPGIVVLDSRSGRAWKARDRSSMGAERGFGAPVGGRFLSIDSGVKALALSARGPAGADRTLFYSPLASYQLYAVNTSVLRNEQLLAQGDVSRYVTRLGNKTSFSQAMVVDSRNMMYLGLNSEDSIARWDIRLPLEHNIHLITKDKDRLQWPSSFAFDQSGTLWVISNRFQNFLENAVNVEEDNYRVMNAYIGSKSYLYPQESFIQYTEMPPHSTDSLDDHVYHVVSTSVPNANDTNYTDSNYISNNQEISNSKTSNTTGSADPQTTVNEIVIVVSSLIAFGMKVV